MIGPQASGSTNINEALLTAISMAKKIGRNKHYESVKQNMIIFLTDGEATVGETYTDQIKKNVQEAIGKLTLFKNMWFLFDEMTKRNTSKFAIFNIYKNPKLLFPFFISSYLTFFPNECHGLCRHRQGHSLRKKAK